MKKHFGLLLLCIVLACMTILAGCGKEKESSLNASESMRQNTSQPEETEQPYDTVPQEQDSAVTFDYTPGSMGIYVKADPDMEADPEVLDSLTMTLSDKKAELIRQRVSNCQFDFVKSGHQIGGFVLVDIPREMLEKEPESWEEFTSVVDYIAKQVMPDAYPTNSYISGGGHLDFGFDLPSYMTFMIQNDNKDQYIHNIYVGEKYVYDFWFDTGWLADSGETIMSTLSAEDIKPELNQSTSWSIHDFPDYPGASQR